MKKVTLFLYSILAYLFFFGSFLYLIGFVENLFVPKGVDDGVASHWIVALIVNLALIALFGVSHSVMARQGFKRWITQYIPPAAERSTYVLVATLFLDLLMWQWRPMPAVIWQIEGWGQVALYVLFGLGWAILLLSTFLINHFELFGLQQGLFQMIDRQPGPIKFVTPLLYKFVRHPMMLGIIIALFATANMTVGHLVLAAGFTVYVLFGIQFEEKDLAAALGPAYRQYQQEVPMLIPGLKPRSDGENRPVIES